MKYSKDLLVKKKSEDMKYKLSIMNNMQLKIMNLVIGKLDNNLELENIKDKDLIFNISKKEILKLLNIKRLDYKKFRKDMDGLSKKQIQYNDNGKEEFINLTIFPYIKYSEDNLYLEINKRIIKYYTDYRLKPIFTQYYFKNIIGFKSKYSLLMYELLKKDYYEQNKNNKKENVIYELDYLLEKLQVEAKSMKLFKHFKTNILDKTQEEINNQTTLNFHYEVVKKGKKVVGIEIIKLFDRDGIEERGEELDDLYLGQSEAPKTKLEIMQARLIQKLDIQVNELEIKYK